MMTVGVVTSRRGSPLLRWVGTGVYVAIPGWVIWAYYCTDIVNGVATAGVVSFAAAGLPLLQFVANKCELIGGVLALLGAAAGILLFGSTARTCARTLHEDVAVLVCIVFAVSSLVFTGVGRRRELADQLAELPRQLRPVGRWLELARDRTPRWVRFLLFVLHLIALLIIVSGNPPQSHDPLLSETIPHVECG